MFYCEASVDILINRFCPFVTEVSESFLSNVIKSNESGLTAVFMYFFSLDLSKKVHITCSLKVGAENKI